MKSRLLAITLAVVLAVVGIVAVLAYVRQANDRAVNGLRAETVLVAAGAIPAGTSLSEAKSGGLLTTEKVPDSSLTTAAVQAVTAVNGNQVVSGPVAKGQILLNNMLAATAADAQSSGGFVVPSGKIAISIDVCIPEAVAGYVTAGSEVAVFDTTFANNLASQQTASCSPQHPILGTGDLGTGQVATALVLPEVEVLAVGQNPVGQSTSAGSTGTVTTEPASSASSSSSEVLLVVAVTQSQAQDLILVGQVGIPYLALLGSNPPDLQTSKLIQNLGQAQP